MAFSILYWLNYVSGTRKLHRKSEMAVNSDHVLKFLYDPETKFAQGVVQASMRDRSYKVWVSSLNLLTYLFYVFIRHAVSNHHQIIDKLGLIFQLKCILLCLTLSVCQFASCRRQIS